MNNFVYKGEYDNCILLINPKRLDSENAVLGNIRFFLQHYFGQILVLTTCVFPLLYVWIFTLFYLDKSEWCKKKTDPVVGWYSVPVWWRKHWSHPNDGWRPSQLLVQSVRQNHDGGWKGHQFLWNGSSYRKGTICSILRKI